MIVLGLWVWPAAKEFDQDPALTMLPLVWMVGALMVYFVGAKEITANPWNLHMFHVPLAFAIGRGMLVLLRAGSGAVRGWQVGLRLAVLLVIVLGWSVGPLVHSIKDDRAQSGRLLGQRVAELRDPSDLAILIGAEVGDPIALYYSRGKGWVFPPGNESLDWSVLYDNEATAIAELEQLRAEGAVWFGVTRDATDKRDRRFLDGLPGVIDHLNATARLVEDNDVFLLWRLDQPST